MKIKVGYKIYICPKLTPLIYLFQPVWNHFSVYNVPNNQVKSGFALIPYSVSLFENCSKKNMKSTRTGQEKKQDDHIEEKIFILVFEQTKYVDFTTLVKYISPFGYVVGDYR